MKKAVWANERGSAALLTVFLLGLAFVAAMLLYYFYSVYIEKRQSQNIADAVALASADVLRDAYRERIISDVTASVRELWETVQAIYDAQPDPPSPVEGEAPPAIPPPPKKTKEEILRELIADPVLENKLAGGSFNAGEDWLLVVLEAYFAGDYTASRNGDRLYDTFNHAAPRIEAAAKRVIDKNGGRREGTEIAFPVEGKPLLHVKAVNEFAFGGLLHITDELPSRSASSIDSSRFGIDVSGKPVRKIMF